MNDAACESYTRCLGQIRDTSPSIVALGLAHDCSGLDLVDASWVEVLRRGHVRVDEERAANCRRDTLDCIYRSHECDLVFVGTLADGATCIDRAECLSGECSGNRLLGLCGVCEPSSAPPAAALGEPCGYDGDCAPIPGETVVCNGTCALRGTLAENEGCLRSDAVCGHGLLCNAANVCAYPLPVGAPCWPGDNCVRGAYCSAIDVVAGSCIAVVLHGEGGSCETDVTVVGVYEYCDYSKDLLCDHSTHRCVRTTTVGRDEPCDWLAKCRDGLYCANGTCADLLPAGSTCFAPYQCASGRCDAQPGNTFSCAAALPICE